MQRTAWPQRLAAAVIVGLTLAGLHPAAAQQEVTIRLSRPDVDRFPEITLFASVSDAQGRRVSGLAPQSFQVLEDGIEAPTPDVAEVLVGTRQVFAVNTTAGMRLRDAFGRSRFEVVQQALLAWWQSPTTGTLGIDDLTLLVGGEVLAAHLSSAAQLASLLDQSTAPEEPEQSDLGLVLQALDFLSDPPPRPGMPGYLVLITPLLEPGQDLALVNAIARANEAEAVVYPILVAPPGAETLLQAEALRQLAEGTGGSLLVLDPAEGLTVLAASILEQRTQYQLSYPSAVNASGTHSLQVQLVDEGQPSASADQTFLVNLLPPEVVFINPPTRIERRSDDPTVTIDALPPTGQTVRLLVTFPDGYPRTITSSQLVVDGQVVAENLREPFNEFAWDLSGYASSDTHLLRAQALDSLGLEGVSADLPVTVDVVPPPRGLAALRHAVLPLGVALAFLAAGIVLAVHLTSQARNRPSSDSLVPKPSARRAALKRAGLQPRTTAEEAEAILIPLEPADGLDPFPLSGADVILGRDASLSTLAINDGSLAGMHARIIRLADGGYWIRDLGSLAGTRVNFALVPEDGIRLHHGDRIDVGRTALVFRLATPPPPRRIEVRSLAAPRQGPSVARTRRPPSRGARRAAKDRQET